MTFKNIAKSVFTLLFLITTACQTSDGPLIDKDKKISSKQDSVSFALGYQNGEFLAREGATEFNYDAYVAGFINGIEGNESLDQTTRANLIDDFRFELSQAIKKKNKEEGEIFLAENKTKEGVIETASGLQYKVLKEGTGKSPEATSTVSVNYEGQLLDGTYFDTNNKELAQAEGLYDARREPYGPIEFPLNRVISGWTEGVQLMKEGAIYEFYIPSDLAYGSNTRPGGPIGPNSTLIFKVELLEVKE